MSAAAESRTIRRLAWRTTRPASAIGWKRSAFIRRVVLAALPQKDGNPPWVIAGRLPGTHLTNLQHPWRRIRECAELHDVRIHDLRHSFASRAMALGKSLTGDR